MSLDLSLKTKTNLEKELESILSEKLKWFRIKVSVWGDEINVRVIWNTLHYETCTEDIDECVEKAFTKYKLPKLLVKYNEIVVKAKTYYEANAYYVSFITEISIQPRYNVAKIELENVVNLIQKVLSALLILK